MLSAVIAFFLQRPSLIALVALAMACGVQTLRIDHAKHDLASLKEANARAEMRAADRLRAAQAVSAASKAQLASERVQIVTRTKTLRQEVPVYVPASADAQCIVPLGFVRLHDAGAQGLPKPAGGSDQAPSGVSLSAVADTVLENYGIAYDWRAEALSWRAWYVKEAAIFNAKP